MSNSNTNVFCFCLFFGFSFCSILKHQCKATLATRLPIEMSCHEDSCSTFFASTFPTQTINLSVVIDTVILQYCQLHLLVLMLYLLWGSVIFLLTLLAPTSEPQY